MVNHALLLPGEFESCIGAKCNFFNFPQDRLLCQQCENCDMIQREPQLCPVYFKYHMACTSYIMKDSNQIKRGCQSDPFDNTCEEGKEKCVYCVTDDCNRDPRTRSLHLRCYQCDEKDGECYAVQEHTRTESYKIPVNMGSAHYCWTIFAGANNGVVFRYHQFHNDFASQFANFCGPKKLIPSPQCKRCFGNNCNNHNDHGHCYECLEDNPDCDHLGLRLTPVYCEKNYLDNFGCYGLILSTSSNASLRRGCITDLDYLHRKSCLESQTCFFCRANNCNLRANLCYNCSETIMAGSQKSDEGCLQTKNKQFWSTAYCGNGDHCFLHLWTTQEGNMMVERGCIGGNLLVNPWQELSDPGGFEICNTHLCNDGEALTNKHDCLDINNKVVHCLSKSNQCYTAYYLDAKGTPLFERGCYDSSNKFSATQKNCDTHISTCTICSGYKCNSNPVEVNMTLECIVCNDRRDCMYYDERRHAVKCVGKRYFFEHESCFYGLDLKSNNITRGCTMLAYPRGVVRPTNFFYCPTNGCNEDSVNDFHCYQCDSNSPNAAPGYCFVVVGEENEIMQRPSPCLGEPIFQVHEMGCYTYYTPTRILKRGCIRHLNVETISFCEKNQTRCKLCYQEGCNNVNIKNGLARLGGVNRVIILLILLISI